MAPTVLLALGAGVIILSLVDLVWTTLAVGAGSGPLTRRLSRLLWRATGPYRRRANKKGAGRSSWVGVGIVVVVLLVWIALIVVGWTLVFNGSARAVIDAETGRPASGPARVSYAGSSVFTLGSADQTTGGEGWRLLTIVATGTGLAGISLAVTYLVPVAAAVAGQRQLMRHISSLGTDAEDVVCRAWHNKAFDGLEQHLVALTPLIHGVGQLLHNYPVLHYFHTPDRRAAAAPNLAVLEATLTLVGHGVAPPSRPDPLVLHAVSGATEDLIEAAAWATEASAIEPSAAPKLSRLREAGIPVVDDDEFDVALTRVEGRRGQVAGLLADEGWPM